MDAHLEHVASGASRDGAGSGILSMVMHAVALTALFGMLVFGVPCYEAMFKEMRMALPSSTQLVISLSNFTKNFGLVLFLPVLLADGAVYFVLRAHAQTRALSKAWSVAVMIVLLLCAVLVIVGVHLPLHGLMTEVGSS